MVEVWSLELLICIHHTGSVRPAEKMHCLGIEIGADLQAKSLTFVQQHFGKSGPDFHGIARGIDNRQVKPTRVRKSVVPEDTFRKDVQQLSDA